MENNPDEAVTLEKAIFTAISDGKLIEFKNLLAQHMGDVDFLDENSLTPLQQAAYEGSKEMVQLLLDRGADVNSGKHKFKYTALHFGALSGNSEVCKLLLDAGAKPAETNSVGRTATQMAAFVGHHNTVATINNYVPLSEISYYSVPQKQQKEPLLPAILVEPLRKFIMGVNIHPVRLALNLQHTPMLLDNADKVSQVLKKLCKRAMTNGDAKEVLSFKYHYLGYIVRELNNIRDKQLSNTDKDIKKPDVVEIFAKKLLKPGKDGVTLDLMDLFIKACVREFPYRQCSTFYKTVSSLTSNDPSPALSVINCTINGERSQMVDGKSYCNTCGEEKPAKKCSKCKTVQYCDRECQRLHWFVHKKVCNSV